MRGLRSTAATVLAGLALVAAGCGDEDDAGAGADGPAALIPGDAILYMEAKASPTDDQRADLEAFLGRLGELPLVGSIEDPYALLASMFDEAAAEDGVDASFAEDVEPWLGERAALGLTGVEDGSERFVFALETTDDDIARESLARILENDSIEYAQREYEGVEYWTTPADDYGLGVFDGHVVLATLDDFESTVDLASDGGGLAEDPKFAATLEPLADDLLGTFYVDMANIEPLIAVDDPSAAEELEAARSLLPEFFDSAMAFGVGAAADQLFFEAATPLLEGQPQSGGSDLLAGAPADAVAAFTLEDTGSLLEFFIDQYDRAAESGIEIEDYPVEGAAAAFEDELGVPFSDFTATLGDAVGWVRGDLARSPELGAEVEISDEETVAPLLDAASSALEQEGARVGEPLGDAGTGLSADFGRSRYGGYPGILNLELGDGLLSVGAYENRAAGQRAEGAVEPGEGAANEAYLAAQEALGSDFELIAYADLGTILGQLVDEATIPEAVLGGASAEQVVMSFLADKAGVIAAGVSYTDEHLVQRFSVGLAP